MDKLAVLPSASTTDVQGFLDQLWNDLTSKEELRARLSSQGVDISVLDSFSSNPYTVERRQDGNTAGFAEAVLIGITIAAGAELTKKVLDTLWEIAIKPRLEKRFGKVSKS